MTIDPKLLEILACPEDKSPLELASSEILSKLNQQIQTGTVKNRAAEPIQTQLSAALIRADKKILYPIIDGIPVLLKDQGIILQ